MNLWIHLLKLTENDKRVLIAICLLFILLFVLVGYIVVIVRRIMRRQAKQVDTFMYDAVRLRVIKTPRHFRKVAHIKSCRYLFKKSWIPVLLMSIASITLLIFCLIKGEKNISFLFSPDHGFPTLFYLFDWKNVPRANFFGLNLPCDWPPILVTAAGRKCTPAFLYKDIYAWMSYIIVPLFVIGAIWYLITIQAFIAREYRILKMSKDVFKKNLDALADDNTI